MNFLLKHISLWSSSNQLSMEFTWKIGARSKRSLKFDQILKWKKVCFFMNFLISSCLRSKQWNWAFYVFLDNEIAVFLLSCWQVYMAFFLKLKCLKHLEISDWFVLSIRTLHWIIQQRHYLRNWLKFFFLNAQTMRHQVPKSIR